MKRQYKKIAALAGSLLLAGFISFAIAAGPAAKPAAVGAVPAGYDEGVYGPAAPIIWNKPVKGVFFSHKTHTMDMGLSCDSCHDELFEMMAGAAEEKADFTMESLYAGKYCGACHDGSMAFASNTRCTTCHIGVKGVKRMSGGVAAPAAH